MTGNKVNNNIGKPFMTCSARLPVYLILISVVIPDKYFFIFNYQGLTLLGYTCLVF